MKPGSKKRVRDEKNKVANMALAETLDGSLKNLLDRINTPYLQTHLKKRRVLEQQVRAIRDKISSLIPPKEKVPETPLIASQETVA